MWEDVLDPNNTEYYHSSDTMQGHFRPALTDYWNRLSPSQRHWMELRGINGAAGLVNEIRWQWRPSLRKLTRAAPALQGIDAFNVSPAVVGPMLEFHRIEDFMGRKQPSHDGTLGASAFEQQPHGAIHSAVGGFMTGNLSPVDPVFWLHHCNIDRLWAVWQARQRAAGRPAFPADPIWATERFEFFVDEHGADDPRQAGEYIDIAKLARPYTYEPGFGAGEGDAVARDAGVGPAAVAVIHSPKLAAVLALGTVVEHELTVPLHTGDAPVVATFTLSAPLPTGVNLEVFVDAPDISAKTPVTAPQFAGASALFGDHHHGHGHGAFNVSILLNPALTASMRAKAGPIRIQLRPTFQSVDGSAEPPAALDVKLLRVEVAVQ